MRVLNAAPGRAWIAVAAADQRQRQLWATTSQTAQADPDGSFRIATLPGRYVAQAFPPLVVSSRRNAWRLFSRLGPDAITADLAEREQKAITLTLHER
jgi:hypothetical protein